jgi:hypothetical protein
MPIISMQALTEERWTSGVDNVAEGAVASVDGSQRRCLGGRPMTGGGIGAGGTSRPAAVREQGGGGAGDGRWKVARGSGRWQCGVRGSGFDWWTVRGER